MQRANTTCSDRTCQHARKFLCHLLVIFRYKLVKTAIAEWAAKQQVRGDVRRGHDFFGNLLCLCHSISIAPSSSLVRKQGEPKSPNRRRARSNRSNRE